MTALQKADLLIALGTRFDDRVTGQLDTFAPHAAIIHADIDPAEIGKNRAADVPIVGDVREVLARADPGRAGRVRRRATRRPHRLVGAARPVARDLPAGLRRARRRHPRPAVRHRAARQDRRPGGDLRRRRRAAPDVGGAVHLVREPVHLAQLRRRRHDGLRGAGGDGRQGRLPGQARCGRSTATAASR